MKKIIPVLSLLLLQGSVLFSQSGIITTIAGNGVQGYSGNGGPATNAELYDPGGVVIDSMGNIYIADRFNDVIRMINTSGIISTFAGNHIGGYSGDGGPATSAELGDPVAILIDHSGNFLISDEADNCVRKINSSGIITTIAGNGHSGYSGDGGAATSAELSAASWFDIDKAGNLYIADLGNNVVRMVNTSGIISTFAGNGHAGYSGNGGPATAAEFYDIEGVGVDDSDNVFIPDDFNNVIRKVNTSGIISTVVGNHAGGYSGDGGPATAAELREPCDVKFDVLENMYIADEENNVVRMVNSSGIISTVAGNGTYGYSGDGGQATDAELSDLNSVAFDKHGNIYIADTYNDRIRIVTGITTGIPQLSTSNSQLLIYPNPSQNVIYVQVQGRAKAEGLELYTITGQRVLEQKISSSNSQLSTINSQLL